MNINFNNEDGKLTRVFAVIGFVLLVILLAWLAIQVVRLIPAAFSSLANVFEANQRELEDRTTDEDDEVVVVVDDENNNTDEEVVDDVDEVDEDTDSDEVEPVATSTPTKPTTSTPTAPVQYRTVATYQVPVSDPNGYTDLAANFVAVGKMTSNERFAPSSSLDKGETGAVQFQIKNNGTKTSGAWHFVAKLPNGQTLTSKVQNPLGPSEVTTLTLAFDAGDSRGKYDLEVTAVGGNDTLVSNNSFRTEVTIR